MRKTIEYRVRQVTRYIVTRYEEGYPLEGGSYAQCETVGLFENEKNAEAVAKALRETDK